MVDVRLYQDLAVEPGMAFSVEPNVELAGVGTFRHCNTVIVTATGCEVDSSLPRGPIWR
jgi:Xaa-Pro dipeptidase